jgi:hypothetical protein
MERPEEQEKDKSNSDRAPSAIMVLPPIVSVSGIYPAHMKAVETVHENSLIF